MKGLWKAGGYRSLGWSAELSGLSVAPLIRRDERISLGRSRVEFTWRNRVAAMEKTSSNIAVRVPGKAEGSILAAFVAEHLGLDLAAYTTGADEELFGRWISGELEPELPPLGRLQAAYDATRHIVNRYD